MYIHPLLLTHKGGICHALLFFKHISLTNFVFVFVTERFWMLLKVIIVECCRDDAVGQRVVVVRIALVFLTKAYGLLNLDFGISLQISFFFYNTYMICLVI